MSLFCLVFSLFSVNGMHLKTQECWWNSHKTISDFSTQHNVWKYLLHGHYRIDSQLSVIQETITWKIWLGNSHSPSTSLFWSCHCLFRDWEATQWNDVFISVQVPHSSVGGNPEFLMARMFCDHLWILYLNGELTFTYRKYSIPTSVRIKLI